MTLQSESIDKIGPAMLAFQAELTPAPKDSLNPHFDSRYADLASIWSVVKGPLVKAGLFVIQPISEEGGDIVLTTKVIHAESGQWFGSTIRFQNQTARPQVVGSSLAYFRRYSMASLLCIVQDDDDGNAGMPPAQRPENRSKDKTLPSPEKKQRGTLSECVAYAAKKTGKDQDEIYGFALDYAIEKGLAGPGDYSFDSMVRCLKGIDDEGNSVRDSIKHFMSLTHA